MGVKLGLGVIVGLNVALGLMVMVGLGVRVAGGLVNVAVGKRVAVPRGSGLAVAVAGAGVEVRSVAMRDSASARMSCETASTGRLMSNCQVL